MKNEFFPKVGYAMSLAQVEPRSRFHPDLEPQNAGSVWCYGSGNVPFGNPTPLLIKGRYEPICTRIYNNLPVDRAPAPVSDGGPSDMNRSRRVLRDRSQMNSVGSPRKICDASPTFDKSAPLPLTNNPMGRLRARQGIRYRCCTTCRACGRQYRRLRHCRGVRLGRVD